MMRTTVDGTARQRRHLKLSEPKLPMADKDSENRAREEWARAAAATP
jgi:hypothetical protein